MIKRKMILGMIFVFLMVGSALGADDLQARGAEGTILQPAGPSYPAQTKVPAHLLNRPPARPVILPTEPGQESAELLPTTKPDAQTPSEPLRLPEGYIVANRQARIEMKDSSLIAHLAPHQELPDIPAIELLPNQRMAMIEAALEQTSPEQTPDFLLTGRVTEFFGKNYLLVENVVELLAPPAMANAEITDAQDRQPGGEAANDTMNATIEPAREPTAEEIAQQLLADRPLKAALLSQEKTADATVENPQNEQPSPQAGRQGQDTARWPAETLLVSRLGRIVPGEDGQWIFAFENQGKNPIIRPIQLLPNRLLEQAITMSRGGTSGAVFSISGEVTLYDDTNYLLLRKVLEKQDMGNLH